MPSANAVVMHPYGNVMPLERPFPLVRRRRPVDIMRIAMRSTALCLAGVALSSILK